MIEILNEAGEVVPRAHKTPKEAAAWIRWALTVRPGVKYKVKGCAEEELKEALEPPQPAEPTDT